MAHELSRAIKSKTDSQATIQKYEQRITFMEDENGDIFQSNPKEYQKELLAGTNITIEQFSSNRIIINAIGIIKDFLNLNDVPKSYAGASGNMIVVNQTETGLEFTAGMQSENTVSNIENLIDDINGDDFIVINGLVDELNGGVI